MIPRPLTAAVALALTAFALPGAASAYEQLPSSLARLTPSDVEGKVRVSDDPLEHNVVLSTREAWKRGQSVEGAHATDVHLRAVVNRDTGRISWQVWHDLTYPGAQRDLVAVNYLAGGTLSQTPLIVEEHWTDNCPGTDGTGSCNQFTRLAFEVPEAVIREIADSYRSGSRTPWRLRFKDANGGAITSGIAPAEAAGLVRAIERWRQGKA